MIRFPNISFEIGEIARAKVRFFFSNFLVNFIVEQLSNKNRQTKTRSIPIWTIFTVKSYFHLRDENYCKLIIVNFFTNSLSQLSLIALLTLCERVINIFGEKSTILRRSINIFSNLVFDIRDNDDDDRSVGQL